VGIAEVIGPVVEESAHDALIGFAHKVWEGGTEMLGGFDQIVVRDLGEQVMDLVGSNVVDDVVDAISIRTIDR
jgi:hypothetical protein